MNAESNKEHPTVLVVDDEQITCDLLRTMLSSAGYRVITATSGREGLALFCQQRPRFTLLDLRMPDMPGIDVLREIRKVDQYASVIILTAWGTDEIESQARKLGVTDFLSKSVTFDAIMASTERVLQREAPARAASGSGTAVPAATAEEGAILVVDDEPQIRDVLAQSLTRLGYRVRAASNGPEALASVEQEKPALVILDMYMPGMNGNEVLKRLRKMMYKNAVILLTSSQDQQLLKEAWELGVLDVMGKPLDLERLALIVRLGLQVKH
ncbi:MAG: response regulator [Nitrospirota bacterium]